MIPNRQLYRLGRHEDDKGNHSQEDSASQILLVDTDKIRRTNDIFQVRQKSNRQRIGVARRLHYVVRADASGFYNEAQAVLKGQNGCIKTLRKLVKAPVTVLRLQRRFIKPILTVLYLTLKGGGDDEKEAEGWTYICKWWSFLTNLILRTGGLTEVTRQWKNHALWVRNHFLQKIDFVEPYDVHHPALPKWLFTEISNFRLLERVGTYIGTRSLPAGGKDVEAAARLKTLKTLSSTHLPLTEEEKNKIQISSRIAGEEVGQFTGRVASATSAHVSVSNRSCYERSGADGGKFSFILEEYHKKWLQEKPNQAETIRSPTGSVFVFQKDEPRWSCSIDDEDFAFSGEFGEPKPDTGYVYPCLEGCDEHRLSRLLHCWSFIYLVKEGYLDLNGKPTGKPFPARLTSVGEPGGKVRVPTISLAAYVTYLQPFQHIMTKLLETDPTLSAGLGAAVQAFEFAKRGEGIRASHEGLLLGDLEDATNNISWEVARLHWKHFFEGLGIKNHYMLTCPLLVTSPLSIIDDDGDVWVTCSGIPMGLPGAKATLHSLGKAVEVNANGQEAAASVDAVRSSRFANAGDDIAKLGSIEILQRHKTSAVTPYRLKPSEDKWGIYKVGGPFCEVMIQLGGIMTHKVNDLEDRETSFVVDSRRARLISSETKGVADEDTNPTFGKGCQLGKELSWSEDLLQPLATLMFSMNFRDYGLNKPFMALPVVYGGAGFPMPDSVRYAWTPPLLLKAMAYAYSLKGTSAAISVITALSSLSKRLLYSRGTKEETVSTDLIDLLTEFAPAMDLETIEDIEEIEYTSGYPRYWDRLKAVRSKGYMRIPEDLERPPVPYWEKAPKPEKGWATAPFSTRLRRVERRLEKLDSFENFETPPEGDFPEIFRASKQDLKGAQLYIHQDTALFDEDLSKVVSLNLGGNQIGSSLRMGISNRFFFKKNDWFHND